jgi:predicted dehydrogenase
MLLRFANGAKGTLWCSQVAVGNENGLRIRLYGEKGGLEWHQENPNALTFTPLGEPPRLIRRNGAGSLPIAQAASRIPAGHPEGYLEAFAQLYTDIAELIAARMEGREPEPFAQLVPQAADGIRGVRFIEAAVKSSAADGAWTQV